jgi:hypothetical protein
MLPHWDTVIKPFLEALGEGPMIEVGAAWGDTTERLAQLAAEYDTVLHTVDPEPQFDVSEYERRFGRHLRIHRERSFDALEHVEAPSAVLIDGDHNWYTVHGELTRLAQLAASAERPFPLVMLHDVEWPYARRDMYYDPEAIPAEQRKPWARRGIGWGRSELEQEPGGLNPKLANAIEEGGPRNGVLTAVEDFIAGCPDRLELRIVRGTAGIGVLVSENLLSSHPAVRRLWERLRSPEFLLAEVERLSMEAAEQFSNRVEASWEAGRLRRELEAIRERPPITP